MSDKVKLGSKLPGGKEAEEFNGLDSLADHLIQHPEELQVVIGVVDVSKVMIDTDTGDHVPYVRWRKIEPVGSLDDAPKAVKDAMSKAQADRLGRAPLPLETGFVSEHDDPGTKTIDEIDA